MNEKKAPNDWMICKIGDICKTTQGIQIPMSHQILYHDDGYRRYLYINDFKEETNLRYVEDKYQDKVVTENDLVMANTGSPGAVFKGIEGILSNNLFKITFDNIKISRDYLFFFLSSPQFQNILQQKMKGGIQKHLGHKTINEQNILIPPMYIQKKIVEVLEKAENALKKRKEAITLVDELVKSRFIEMFGDPINPLESVKLGDVALLERGRFSPRPRNDPKYYNGEYPFIQTGDISNSNHRLNKYKQTLNEEGIKVSKCFKTGTIVIAIVGATIGATAILEREVYAPDSVIGITPVEGCCNNIFLEMVLRFWQPELLRMAPESARANINLGILKNIPIIKTDFELQNQFANFVNQVDKLKFEMEKSLKELENNFNSLMQKAFNGELF